MDDSEAGVVSGKVFEAVRVWIDKRDNGSNLIASIQPLDPDDSAYERFHVALSDNTYFVVWVDVGHGTPVSTVMRHEQVDVDYAAMAEPDAVEDPGTANEDPGPGPDQDLVEMASWLRISERLGIGAEAIEQYRNAEVLEGAKRVLAGKQLPPDYHALAGITQAHRHNQARQGIVDSVTALASHVLDYLESLRREGQG